MHNADCRFNDAAGKCIYAMIKEMINKEVSCLPNQSTVVGNTAVEI